MYLLMLIEVSLGLVEVFCMPPVSEKEAHFSVRSGFELNLTMKHRKAESWHVGK